MRKLTCPSAYITVYNESNHKFPMIEDLNKLLLGNQVNKEKEIRGKKLESRNVLDKQH